MKIVKIAVVALMPFVLSGCFLLVAAAAGGTGALYVKGAAQKDYPQTVQRTYDAVLAVFDEADIIVTTKTYGATVAKVTGAASDGKKVIVDLEATGDKVTQVRIRVGTLGDRQRSEYIMSLLDTRL